MFTDGTEQIRLASPGGILVDSSVNGSLGCLEDFPVSILVREALPQVNGTELISQCCHLREDCGR